MRNTHSKGEREAEEGPIRAEIIHNLGTEPSLCRVPDRSCVSASSPTATVGCTNRQPKSGRMQAGYFGAPRKRLTEKINR